MQRNFQNKTVVITGACRGIGAGIAERFARDGANLVMVSNAERVHETAETLRQRYQADILSLQVDVTDEARCSRCTSRPRASAPLTSLFRTPG
jgi:NAD(P)-dependent dehydrogenase (short-subunit alcohol dehydrogenase family)